MVVGKTNILTINKYQFDLNVMTIIIIIVMVITNQYKLLTPRNSITIKKA